MQGNRIGRGGVGKKKELSGGRMHGFVEIQKMPAEKLEEHAADGFLHAIETDEGSDRLAREHVRDCREEICLPRLIGTADLSD